MTIAPAVLALAFFQVPPITNPSRLAFLCPDHAQDTDHEIDIIDSASGAVISTLLGGDPAPLSTGEVEITLQLQPVKFGSYRFVVRAIAGAIKGANSLPSDIWLRAPGAPTKLVVK